MRKLAVATILLIITAALSGCIQLAQSRAEIDKLFITRILSIDEAQDGKVMVTLTTKSLTLGGNGGESPKGESISAVGNTVFEALRNMTSYSYRKPNFGHTEFILFGDSIARKGILPYLDYISREHEFRYNAKIYIVKGGTASSIVKNANTSRLYVRDRLSDIEENAAVQSLASIVTLNEAIQILEKKSLDTFIPYIEAVTTKTTEEKQSVYDISLGGYAIFRDDKLLYYAPGKESRGINWIMNRIGSGIIEVKGSTGEKVLMEIIYSRVKLTPKIEGSKLRCSVDVFFTTNISEVYGRKNVFTIDSLKYLKDQQEEAVKHEIEDTLMKAQKYKSDHFGIISKFIIKYPLLKNYLQENWQDLFPEIEFDINVNSVIKGTYIINEPAGSIREDSAE